MKATQAFNGGVCAIYSTQNAAGRGDKAITKLVVKEPVLRYHQRTVGFSRYYSAAQSNARVDAVLRTPRRPGVSALDIVGLPDGTLYRVRLVQYPEDIAPPVMDMTLERTDETYDITGI